LLWRTLLGAGPGAIPFCAAGGGPLGRGNCAAAGKSKHSGEQNRGGNQSNCLHLAPPGSVTFIAKLARNCDRNRTHSKMFVNWRYGIAAAMHCGITSAINAIAERARCAQRGPSETATRGAVSDLADWLLLWMNRRYQPISRPPV